MGRDSGGYGRQQTIREICSLASAHGTTPGECRSLRLVSRVASCERHGVDVCVCSQDEVVALDVPIHYRNSSSAVQCLGGAAVLAHGLRTGGAGVCVCACLVRVRRFRPSTVQVLSAELARLVQVFTCDVVAQWLTRVGLTIRQTGNRVCDSVPPIRTATP